MNSMTTIRTEEANEKYQQTARRIRLLKEEAAAARIIANKLDNAYITKRLLDKVKEYLPQYRAYISNSSSILELVLHRPDMDYNESFYIGLGADSKHRRIDSEIVKAIADSREAEAIQLEKQLETFYEMVSRYNGLVSEYSTIRDSLYKFFPDIPYVWRRDT